MRHIALVLALPLALITVSGLALADVSDGPKCKCSMPGSSTEGSIAGVMAGSGALLLFASRRRRPR